MKYLFVVGLLVCLPHVAFAAVTVDSTASTSWNGAQTTETITGLTNNGNLITMCLTGDFTTSVTSMTFAGQSLSRAVKKASTTWGEADLWTVATTTQGIGSAVVNMTGNHYGDISVVTFNNAGSIGASGGSLNDATAGDTTASNSITTLAANSLIEDCFVNFNGTVAGAGSPTGTNQTKQVWVINSAAGLTVTQSTQTTIGITSYTQSYSWTGSNPWEMVSMEIEPQAAAPSSPPKVPFLSMLWGWW